MIRILKIIMKLLFAFCFSLTLCFSQSNPPFIPGEKLEYAISYGPMVAGSAVFEVEKDRSNYQFTAIGKSKGLFNVFFKVKDIYKSTIDSATFAPIIFLRDVHEGNYKKKEEVYFNTDLNQAESTRDTIQLPNNYQDLLSVIYYLRTQFQQGKNKNDSIPIQVFLDDEFIQSQLTFLKSDNLKTKEGSISCEIWCPKLEIGRVFKDDDKMKIWVTDDQNSIPLKIETPILFGSIVMELVSYDNIKHPFKYIE